MPATYLIGLIVLLQMAGCTIMRTEPASAVAQGGTVVVERLPPATRTPDAAERPPDIDTRGGTLIIERLPPLPEVVPAVPVAATPPVISASPAAAALPKTAQPVAPVAVTTAAAPDKTTAKLPVKPAVPVVRAATPQKPAAAPVRTTSTLDLDALEQRLKDTDAIGVFTKIALKNQVDDLLKRLKAYHESDGKSALSQLRQSYDQLLLKVNDVLKSGDPALASEIMASREAIWSVLSDPVKFAKL